MSISFNCVNLFQEMRNFFYFIQMSGSVDFEAKVTYKLLTSFKLVCIQTKHSVFRSARDRVKV